VLNLLLLYCCFTAALLQCCFTAASGTSPPLAGTRFTGVTGTKVQILTLLLPLALKASKWSNAFTCFTGTKVQILTLLLALALKASRRGDLPFTCFTGTKVQIQKYKYWR
jgi:hypothetical protein